MLTAKCEAWEGFYLFVCSTRTSIFGQVDDDLFAIWEHFIINMLVFGPTIDLQI